MCIRVVFVRVKQKECFPLTTKNGQIQARKFNYSKFFPKNCFVCKQLHIRGLRVEWKLIRDNCIFDKSDY